MEKIIRHDYVHLSSNYNKPYFELPKLIKMADIELINKLAFVNHPNMTDSKSKPFKRLKYPSEKK